MYKAIASIILISLSGCGITNYLNNYNFHTTQGQNLSKKIVDSIKPGMSKAKVIEILGKPIKKSLHKNRFEYIEYRIDKTKAYIKNRLIVKFKNDFVFEIIKLDD